MPDQFKDAVPGEELVGASSSVQVSISARILCVHVCCSMWPSLSRITVLLSVLPNSDENRSLHCLRFKPIHCHFLSYHGDGFEEVKSRVLAHKECFFFCFFFQLWFGKKKSFDGIRWIMLLWCAWFKKGEIMVLFCLNGEEHLISFI